MSFGTSIIEPIVRDMTGGLGSILGVHLSDVFKGPGEFSPESAEMMVTIRDTAVLPVATSILVVLFMLELVRIGLRTDGDGELFSRVAFFTLVKFGILRVMFEATPVVMSGIYSVFSGLAKATNLTVFDAQGSQASVDSFLDSVDKMGFLEQAVLVIFLSIAWLINRGATLIAMAVVIVRFVKLYIYNAWAPIPMACLAHQDTRQFGIGFLRNFAATVTQAFVLVFAFAVYRGLTAGFADRALRGLPENALEAALSISASFIFMGLILGLVIVGSGRLANELFGN